MALKRQAERLGIVYTPAEVVGFILRSTDRSAARGVQQVPHRCGNSRPRPPSLAPGIFLARPRHGAGATANAAGSEPALSTAQPRETRAPLSSLVIAEMDVAAELTDRHHRALLRRAWDGSGSRGPHPHRAHGDVCPGCSRLGWGDTVVNAARLIPTSRWRSDPGCTLRGRTRARRPS